MCGIAGILRLDGRPPLEEEMSAMCATMLHRGPDSGGIYLSPEAGLAMRRLSIIDVAAGSQPIANEDRSVWTVFNGEIYNFAELRADLESRGHRFETSADTEAIVHLYEEAGPSFVDRLRGMFAVAVWDRNRRVLVLARDRLGIKPLYYAVAGGRLVFASEVKALLQLKDVPRRLDWESVNHLFTALCTPPSRSIVQGIYKLEPGHLLVAEEGRPLVKRRYWEIRFEPDTTKSEEELLEELKGRLEESVRLHLVSDVPLGAFLSGGVDSSAVAAAMTRLTNGRISTFSIGFSEEGFDESPAARLVASALGTDHHEAIVEPDILGILDDLVWHLDEPFGDPSAIPTYLVSKLAAGYVKVVLSGDGGDELFAGYDKYVVEAKERRMRFLPWPLRRALGALASSIPDGVRGRNYLRHISLDGPERYLDAVTLFRSESKRKLFRPDVLPLLGGGDPRDHDLEKLRRARGHWLTRLQEMDMRRYLPLDILTKVDRMSMAHSIEARVPLLDHPLVEFAATIPPSLNLRGSATKRLFKKSLEGTLPPEILQRPKHGFAVPLGAWFRGRLSGFARDLLLSETTDRRGIFEARGIESLLDEHRRGRERDLHLWTLISFELWCRSFLDGEGRTAPGPRANVWSRILLEADHTGRVVSFAL